MDGYAAPQIHTHALTFNLTERENGQHRALQPHSLFASQQFATAMYQSELIYRLPQLGYEIIAGRSGAPEAQRVHTGVSGRIQSSEPADFGNILSAPAGTGNRRPRLRHIQRAIERKFIRSVK